MTEPAVFIGSSTEGLPFARAIKAELEKAANVDAEIRVWDDDLFEIGDMTLDRLLMFRFRFDFALLVLTPDDIAIVRKHKVRLPRDNVLFELGVFMSALGRKKTFVVKTAREVKLPSDLDGLTIGWVDADAGDDITARVEGVARRLGKRIDRESKKSTLGILPSTALALTYFNNFVRNVCSAFSDPSTSITVGEPPNEELLDTEGMRLKFVVVVPDDPKEIAHEAIKQKRRQDKRIRKVTLKSTLRDFPFHTLVREDHVDDEIEFFDIPTALQTSFAALDYVLPPELGDDDDIELLERREIENFRRTVEFLARKKLPGNYVEVTDMSYLRDGPRC